MKVRTNVKAGPTEELYGNFNFILVPKLNP